MHAKQAASTVAPGPRSNQASDPRVEIVDYLLAHPGATDSLDGIVEWWLPRQRFETARLAIQHALDDLTRQGVIEQITVADGAHLYRLAVQPGLSQ